MKIATLGTESQTESMTAGTVGVIVADKTFDQSLVNVKVEYPEDYTGKKFHTHGQVYPMSKETADILVEKGIGTIQTESETEGDADNSDSGESTKKTRKKKES